MRSIIVSSLAAAALCAAAPANAQAVYKCGAQTYSQQPCSARVVRTYEAPVRVSPKPKDVIAHRLPGETDSELATRKHRIALTQSDRDECARLDKRFVLDRERIKTTQQDEIDDAQASLIEGQKRYKQLRC